MKYLLIDGNNLAVRCAFANDGLTNQDGVPTGVHYGMLNSLVSLKKRFPERQFLIVWDGKSARRVAEAQKGVEQGIIPSGYKENRDRGEDMLKPLQDFYAQSDYLKKGLEQTGIPQIRLPEFEADDVIASYAKMLKKDNDIIVVTSDKDYWQILDKNVALWDGMKGEETNKDKWEKEYGLNPISAIDIGAMVGDSSDNIFGVPGWGEKTTIKALQKHGTWENILEAYRKKHQSLREQYPDLTDEKEFKKLASTKANPLNPNSREKFPEIKFNMFFTGVCKALLDNKIKIAKNELMAIMFEERIKLAFSLKKMDDDIPDLPSVKKGKYDKEKLVEYMTYYDVYSLMDDVEVFET